jgi:putative intracellular protease/amidase
MDESRASLFGLTPSYPLPDGFTPLEAVAAVKCLDEAGHLTLIVLGTPDLTLWERVGMLQAAWDQSRESLLDSFVLDGEDEE